MSDTTTITPEERHSWRERLTSEFSCFNAELGNFTLRSLNALEHAEARAEHAEANVARLNKMVDWLSMHLSGYDAQKKCTVYADDWKEAARKAVAAGEE